MIQKRDKCRSDLTNGLLASSVILNWNQTLCFLCYLLFKFWIQEVCWISWVVRIFEHHGAMGLSSTVSVTQEVFNQFDDLSVGEDRRMVLVESLDLDRVLDGFRPSRPIDTAVAGDFR